MRILLDCHNLKGGSAQAEKKLFLRLVTAMLAEKEGVEWLFLVDRSSPDDLDLREIGQNLPVRGAGGGWVRRQLWYHWYLPRIAKRVSPDRVLTMDELEGIAGAAGELYRPLPGEEKEEVKEHYTEGKEYFLTDTAGMGAEQVVGLLKAFSLFKKRQRSNMRFLLRAGAVRGRIKGIPINLENYKYRSDLSVIDDPGEEEWRRLMGAAYLLVVPPGAGELPIFNGWKTETPVIAAASLQRIGEGGLTYQPGVPATLAAPLMSLYTNEGLREELIGRGRDRLKYYSWERSAQEVWELIIGAGGAANRQ